jgi:hypothetical protein
MLYTLWNNKQNKKPIIIKPIKIAPLIIKEEPISEKVTKPTNPSDILLKLKIATSKSREKHEQRKEETVNKILNTLKQQVSKQTKIQEQKPVLIVKKLESNIAKVIHKPKIKEIIKKPIPKTEKKLQVVEKIAAKEKKVPPIKIIQNQLSREEEVALYKHQYADKLEIVGVSESFEIEAPINNLPDTYYFETHKASSNEDTENIPLAYVEKLGVVNISNAYEVNFTIPD